MKCEDISNPRPQIRTGSVDIALARSFAPKKKKKLGLHSTYRNANEDDDLSLSDSDLGECEDEEEERSVSMQNMDRCKGVETSVIR